MAAFLYPTNAELTEIEQSLLPVLTQDDPIFEILPIEDADTDQVMWEQEDDYIGLQQLRGINGEPPKVDPVGQKRFRMDPGYYGEHRMIDEEELTRRRQMGTFDQPINIDDLVRRAQDNLLFRELARVKQIGWLLVTTGTFSVSTASGAIAHTDTYTTQPFDSVVGWGTPATATPLADFRAAQLLSRGYSVDFGRKAKARMNRVTWNKMISNTNSADLYGRRTMGLGTAESLDDVNKLLMGDDLPTVEIYDKGYKNDSGTWVPFIPNDKVVIQGVREDGRPIGAYKMTRNANNPNMQPGSYTWVTDSLDTGVKVPRRIRVDKGHNGGPAMYFPSALIVMDVS